ncbi:alpha-1-antiproteinase-like [Mobula hypostoma]|uniref:alpha-1-antiproteinase-like n=1 Tax=Mobula hypostoma TaxID=723540 RepID=UPI002FC31265
MNLFNMEKLLAFAFLMVALPSSGMVSGYASAVNEFTPYPSLLSLSAANSEFALRLYRQIATQPDTASQNIFFSPLSISASLSMLSLGAKERTRAQLLQVLGYSNMTNNGAVAVRETFPQLLEHLNNVSVGIHMGSSLYVQNGKEIHEKFLKEAEEFYNAETVTVDFHEQQSTKDKINAYVNSKTNGKIPDFLKEPLSSDTLMFLLNYILFKGEWLQPFDTKHTYEADFHVDDRTTVRVHMMRRTGMYYWTYAEDLSSDALLMEYAGNTSLLILLPKSGKLAELERKLTVQRFDHLSLSMQKQSVDVHFPKMTLKTAYKLKPLLSSMGIEDAFTNYANFSGISEQPVKLSKVMHKAVLEVDEEGTKATAVTGMQAIPLSLPVEFKCNRPFLLLIADNYIRSVVFAGRVMNPSI